MADPADPSRHAALLRFVPGLAQLVHYPRGALPGDLMGAIAVAVVTIPSVLAYAELVGVSPEAGLYAALGGMVVYALFTTTRRVVVGPDATIALLAGSVIAPLALGDPGRAAALAAMLALMTGVILIVAGRLGLGNVADLLSSPVLTGYAAGAALILIGTQLPILLGVPLPRDPFFYRIYDGLLALPRANPATLSLGTGLIVLMILVGRLTPRTPGALLACVVAVAASLAFDLGSRGVAHLAPLAAAIPAPSLPGLALRDLQVLAPGALALAVLVFAEGILMARTLAAKHRESIDSGRELGALGAGSLAAGLLSGFPVGASTTRSVTADANGTHTQLAQWIAAAMVALFVLFLAPAASALPRVALGAIVVTAGLRLIDVREWRTLWRLDRRAFGMAGSVAVGVLALGVLPGVLLGVGLSVGRMLVEMARPRDAILRRLATDRRYHDLDDDEEGEVAPGVLVYRLYAPLLFANARHVAARIRSLVAEADPTVRCVVFDLQAVPRIDVTALEIVRDLQAELEEGGIDVRYARANRPLREQLARWIEDEHLGQSSYFPSASAAVDDFLAQESPRRKRGSSRRRKAK